MNYRNSEIDSLDFHAEPNLTCKTCCFFTRNTFVSLLNAILLVLINGSLPFFGLCTFETGKLTQIL